MKPDLNQIHLVLSHDVELTRLHLRGGIVTRVPHQDFTDVMGRLATYSGTVVKWDDAINDPTLLADTDSLHSLTDPAPAEPDLEGCYEVPVPGGTVGRTRRLV